MGRRLDFHNSKPIGGLPEGAPRDAMLQEFGRRVQAAMIKKGWSQTELARNASRYMETGRIGRDSISTYIRGTNLPRPKTLAALARALEIDPDDLKPEGVPTTPNGLELRSVDGGMAWLRVNQAVPMAVALKITALLAECNQEA